MCNCGSRAREDAFTNASAGELFEFPERQLRGLPVCLEDALVIHRDGENGDRLGRRALEVEEDTALFSRHLSQPLACLRVQVIAEPQERFPSDDFTLVQSQLLGTDTDPLSGLLAVRNVLGVVVVMRQVLIEVGGCRTPVLLWLAGEHHFRRLPETHLPACSGNGTT